MLYKTTIIPIEQWDKNLKVLFFGSYYGHTDIYLTNMRTQKQTIFAGADKYAKEDQDFPYKTIVLTNIEPGRYQIYSFNPIKKERSEGFEFRIFGDSSAQNIHKATNIAQSDSSIVDEMSAKIEHNKKNEIETNCVRMLFDAYLKAKSTESKYKYALVLQTYINIQNHKRQNCEFTAVPFKINAFTQEFNIESDTRKVLQYNIITHRMAELIPESDTTTYSMQMDEDNIYLYIQIGNDNIPTDITFYFKPAREIYEKLRQFEIEQHDKYEKAIEKNVSYPSYLATTSDREAEYVTLINELQPDIPIIMAPHVEFSHGEITVSFDDEYVDLINLLFGKLYVSFREPDLCLDKDDSRRICVSSQSFTFDYEELDMIRQDDYLYWVEDETGKVLSDVKVMLLRPVNIYDDEASQSDRDDFVDMLRKIDLYQYCLHLKPYIGARYSDIEDKIIDAYKTCEIDTTCDSPTLYYKMLMTLATSKNYTQFVNMIRCLLEDRTVYGDYLIEFFKAPLRYKYKENTVVMPAMEDTIFVFERYRFGGARNATYISASATHATEYRFTDCDFGVVYAINKNSFKRSGFLIIDYCREGLHASLIKFLLDTVEVID